MGVSYESEGYSTAAEVYNTLCERTNAAKGLENNRAFPKGEK